MYIFVDNSYIGDWMDRPERLKHMCQAEILFELAIICACPAEFDFTFETALAFARGFLQMSEQRLARLVFTRL